MKWHRILPLLYLLATFEHCYETFELYNGGLNFPKVTTVLLVLAIDSSIYFSMQVIHLIHARIILVLSGFVGIVLNVKYMVDWKPDGTFGLIIGIVSGILIPLMLCLFGWLAKEVNQQGANGGVNGALTLKDAIRFYSSRFPKKSDRKIAEIFETSHTTVGRYRRNEVKG